MFGLPLTIIDVGTGGLERELALLLAEADPLATSCPEADPLATPSSEASRP